MRPSKQVNNTIGGILAKAVKLFSIELFAFSFASNHLHMIVRAPAGTLSPFMQYLESNIARKVGRLHNWRDKFWARRFSAEPILDDGALIERLQYVLAHGPKEGLVEECSKWPGLTCLPELLHGVTRIFHWNDETGKYRASRRHGKRNPAEFLVPFRLEVKPLPVWEDLRTDERRKHVKKIIREIENRARTARAGKPVLGAKKVLQLSPHETPRDSTHSARPKCHASSIQSVGRYRTHYREIAALYHEASRRFRDGDESVVFPEYTFKPPLPYGWGNVGPPNASVA